MDNPLNINLNEGNRTDKRKPSQFDQSFIANILSGCSNSVVHTKDELMEYEAEELEPSNCGPDGILLYWAQRSRKWPRLSCMARDILTIPTTSASSERAFIVGKDVYFVQIMETNLTFFTHQSSPFGFVAAKDLKKSSLYSVKDAVTKAGLLWIFRNVLSF
ncbi:hypothetical protein OUZ56_003499 [Daphnia magna]|uniref:HAT C-terminal dimerisation domain-containing protein n=1 Tax=Daphnia magna TaxID=35525 RepID=A0ABR0A8W3_9CRUS|nr:hypothetical protein OUZ56_003499 [Daphnia magna]